MKPVQPHYNKPVPEQQPLHPQRSAGLGLGGASPAPIPWFSLYFWPTMTSSIAVITSGQRGSGMRFRFLTPGSCVGFSEFSIKRPNDSFNVTACKRMYCSIWAAVRWSPPFCSSHFKTSLTFPELISSPPGGLRLRSLTRSACLFLSLSA